MRGVAYRVGERELLMRLHAQGMSGLEPRSPLCLTALPPARQYLSPDTRFRTQGLCAMLFTPSGRRGSNRPAVVWASSTGWRSLITRSRTAKSNDSSALWMKNAF